MSTPIETPVEPPVEPPVESVVVLSRALDQAGDVLARVHEDQFDRPTPCGDWNVARLMAHLGAAPRIFLEMGRGNQPDWSAEPPPVETGWTSRFRSDADDLIHSWHQAGEAADPAKVDWQTAEFALHTWDLARATGQPIDLDPEVAERGLAFMSSALTPENRGQAFAAAQPAPDDAPVYDRLAAYAGRTLA